MTNCNILILVWTLGVPITFRAYYAKAITVLCIMLLIVDYDTALTEVS